VASSYFYKQSNCLDAALNERDSYTQVHSTRVESLSAQLGEKCKLSCHEVLLLTNAARLHDVGKIGIPDHILLKPSSFLPAEWEVMKTHSTIGQQICAKINHKDSAKVSDIVRHHHESFNGSGYPDGLAGEDIPISSRIISIVDSYDAMSTSRPYHQPKQHDEVMEILGSECGKKIDSYVFRHFENIIKNNSNFRN